jgi:hypothetical protein
MIDKAGHIAWAAEAVAVFQKHCGTGDEHAIADLICDLGHLAEERGFDFLSESSEALGIGIPSIMLLIAIILDRTLRWRSQSRQGKRQRVAARRGAPRRQGGASSARAAR